MKAPNATINKLPVFILITGATYTRLGENTMTTIQPAIRAPNETIEGFMTVLNTPTIKQDFRGTIGYIVAVSIGDKDQFGGHTDIHPAHTDRETRAES